MSICAQCKKFGTVAQWREEHAEWEERGKGLIGKEWVEWDYEEPPCPCEYCSLNNFGYA